MTIPPPIFPRLYLGNAKVQSYEEWAKENEVRLLEHWRSLNEWFAQICGKDYESFCRTEYEEERFYP